jgi:hypothetical protein
VFAAQKRIEKAHCRFSPNALRSALQMLISYLNASSKAFVQQSKSLTLAAAYEVKLVDVVAVWEQFFQP